MAVVATGLFGRVRPPGSMASVAVWTPEPTLLSGLVRWLGRMVVVAMGLFGRVRPRGSMASVAVWAPELTPSPEPAAMVVAIGPRRGGRLPAGPVRLTAPACWRRCRPARP
jgi:hypothetical protein